MKHTIKYISFGLASVMALSACSDQFLQDKRNYDNVTEEVYNYFEGAQSRVDDVYSWCLPTVADLAWNNPAMGNNDLAGGSTEEYTGFTKFVDPQITMSALSSDSKLQVPDFFMYQSNNIQASVYGRIRNANDAIAGVQNSTLSQENKNVLLGQLYFLRAWCYYNLVKWYGGVPILDGTPAPEEGAYFERQSAKACFDYILTDLRNAATLLKGHTMTGSDYGRVTTGTALALKGRVLLLWCSPLFNRADDKARWTAAFTEMQADKKDIDACGYDLYNSGDVNGSAFAGQFSASGQNPEAVFFTLYNKVASEDGLDNQKNNNWERTIRPSNAGGSGKRPSKSMMDIFPMSDGLVPSGTANYTKLAHSTKAIDAQAPFVDRDPRFNRTFAFPGFRWAFSGDATQRDGHNPSYNQGRDYVYWGYVWYTSLNDANEPASGNSYASDNLSSGGVLVRKKTDDLDINSAPLYDYVAKAIKGAGPFFSGATLMELRYAEVLLNLAEVACGAGDVNAALGYMNQVRNRAGVPVLTTADFTGGDNEASCMSAILYERMVEFAYEGKRFDDLRRWMLYDGGTVKAEGAPDTWTLAGRWAAGTDVWLGIKKLNGTRRESMDIRVANSYGVGESLWNSDPILKTALNTEATAYMTEWNTAHAAEIAAGKEKAMNVKKAAQVMSVYTKAAETARPVSVDLREGNITAELAKLALWYKGDGTTTNPQHLTIDEKKGDARDSETTADLYINFRPNYYFLGLSSGAQTSNKHVKQTIGWQDANNGGANGTFDPLAE